MKTKKQTWFNIAFRLRGSVISSIYQRVLWLGLFGLIVSVLYYFKVPVYQPVLGGVVPSIVLGLLLVFRTNTAYDRFWEGRRLWGSFRNDSLNMAWSITTLVQETGTEDRAAKIAILRLIVAFVIACKLRLRSESVNSELEKLMSQSQYIQLSTIGNAPLQIISWIGDYVQQQYQRGETILHAQHVNLLQNTLHNMMVSLGGCERILKTPLPLAYTIHLKQLLLIYCLLLPFQVVKDLGWGTGIFITLISFTLIGIEAIGVEIENPFGYDTNDLPLDAICTGIQSDIEEFIAGNIESKSNLEADLLGKLG
jgi:putative membrane protein